MEQICFVATNYATKWVEARTLKTNTTIVIEFIFYECILTKFGYHLTIIDTPPHSLKDSIASPKVETMEEEGIGLRSLVHSTSGVERHVGASGWGLGQVTSESIIHTDMHKPNKLVSA
jgi:hypothetical protein